MFAPDALESYFGDDKAISYQFASDANFADNQVNQKGLTINRERPVVDLYRSGAMPLHPMPGSARAGETFLDRSPLFYHDTTGIMREIPDVLLNYLLSVGGVTREGVDRHVQIPLDQGGRYHCHEAMFLDNPALLKDAQRKLAGKTFIPIFPGSVTEDFSNKIGMTLLNSPEIVYVANHKGSFREAGEKFGYDVPPGAQIGHEGCDNPEEFEVVMDYAVKAIKEGKKIWFKVPTGSGGEFTVAVKPENIDLTGNVRDQLFNNIIKDKLIRYVKSSNHPEVDCDSLSVSSDEVYYFVLQRGIIVEEDIKSIDGFREIYGNFNVQGLIEDNGEIIPVFASRQNTTPEGIYQGNLLMSFEMYEAELLKQLRETLVATGKYLKSVGYRGVFGIDIITANIGGAVKSYTFDMNARLNGSTRSIMNYDKFGPNMSLNTGFEFPEHIHSVEDGMQLLRNGVNNLLFNGKDLIGVYPQVPKDGQDGKGEAHFHGFKADIFAPNSTKIQVIIDKLLDRGIRLA